MSVSAELLERAASETGFDLRALEKVVRLGELAADVTRHPLLGEALALKGGTALNLCWGQPTRLSVDLDYNYIGERDRAAMLAARQGIEHAIEELARRRGYVVQRSTDAFAGRKIYLSFSSAFGAADRIEVDLNFLFRLPIAPPESRRLWQPARLESPQVLAVSLAEFCIGKLLALLNRGAPRDAWDVGPGTVPRSSFATVRTTSCGPRSPLAPRRSCGSTQGSGLPARRSLRVSSSMSQTLPRTRVFMTPWLRSGTKRAEPMPSRTASSG